MTDNKRPDAESVFNSSAFKASIKRTAKRESAGTPTAKDPLQVLGSKLNYDPLLANHWSYAKMNTYVNVLCQRYGVKSWASSPTIGERRAIKELRKLIEVSGRTNTEFLTEITKLFDRWDVFIGYYPKAAEIGFSPPYWTKAWSIIEKFLGISLEVKDNPLSSSIAQKLREDFTD